MHTIIGNNWDFEETGDDVYFEVSCLYTDKNFQERFIRLRKCVFLISQEQYLIASSNNEFGTGSNICNIKVNLFESYKNLGPAIRIELPPGDISILNSLPPGRSAYTVDISKANAAGELGLLVLYAYNYLLSRNSSQVTQKFSDEIACILNSSENERYSEPFRAIGDLDGSYGNFKRLTYQLRVMDIQGNWNCGRETVIFMGDIVADRSTDGFKILEKIYSLRLQAREKGGNIVCLAGNHEEFLLGYLSGEFVNLTNNKNMLHYHEKRIACLDELAVFGPVEEQKNMLTTMQNSLIGRKYLQYLTEFQLCYLIGNTIFFHTPPTKKMLQAIHHTKGIQVGIDLINNRWKRCIERILFENNHSGASRREYYRLASIFLNTKNDTLEGVLSRIGLDGTTKDEIGEIQDRYSEYIASSNGADYQSIIHEGICHVVYGHTNTRIQPIPGITFHPINRTGIISK